MAEYTIVSNMSEIRCHDITPPPPSCYNVCLLLYNVATHYTEYTFLRVCILADADPCRPVHRRAEADSKQ